VGRGGLSQSCTNGAKGKPTAEEHEACASHDVSP
jgi:hypothetical protein